MQLSYKAVVKMSGAELEEARAELKTWCADVHELIAETKKACAELDDIVASPLPATDRAVQPREADALVRTLCLTAYDLAFVEQSRAIRRGSMVGAAWAPNTKAFSSQRQLSRALDQAKKRATEVFLGYHGAQSISQTSRSLRGRRRPSSRFA